MIVQISGILDHVSENQIVLDVNGIGYSVHIPETLITSLPQIGTSVKFFTYHHIREDQQLLFGFLSPEERNFFTILTSVSGIGPKTGLKILSNIKSADLIEAIIKEDVFTISSVPGIGKKTAERVIIELKDKLPKIFNISKDKILSSQSTNNNIKSLEQDLLLALRTLGYSNEETKNAIKKASPDLTADMSLEEAIKIILKNI
jgi:Holliday junction DNA helicase RuvA